MKKVCDNVLNDWATHQTYATTHWQPWPRAMLRSPESRQNNQNTPVMPFMLNGSDIIIIHQLYPVMRDSQRHLFSLFSSWNIFFSSSTDILSNPSFLPPFPPASSLSQLLILTHLSSPDQAKLIIQLAKFNKKHKFWYISPSLVRLSNRNTKNRFTTEAERHKNKGAFLIKACLSNLHFLTLCQNVNFQQNKQINIYRVLTLSSPLNHT